MDSAPGQRGPAPASGLTPVIKAMLWLNGGVFLAELFIGPWLITWFALWPAGAPALVPGLSGTAGLPEFFPWQLLSYGFLHSGFAHLFLNMFGLWMFGSQIEQAWGSRRFLTYYLACVAGAGLIQLLVASAAAQHGEVYPTIGASGALFGILLAFGMLYPNAEILLLIPPIPIKAKYFVLGYGLIELWAGVTGSAEGVAHFAHLGGMLVGFVLIQYWRGRLPFKPRG